MSLYLKKMSHYLKKMSPFMEKMSLKNYWKAFISNVLRVYAIQLYIFIHIYLQLVVIEQAVFNDEKVTFFSVCENADCIPHFRWTK